MTIKEIASLERPREKMIVYGSESLSNAELIAILLRTGDGGKSAIQLAEEVVAYDARGIAFLRDCIPEELSSIKGIGEAKSCQIVAAMELGKRISAGLADKRLALRDPEAVANHFMEQMRHYQKEYFKVLMLNTKVEVIAEDTVAIGNLNSSVIHPREIFSKAIKNSSASMILVHNHPSGNPQPSTEDLLITNRLVKAGEIIGIKILDHIIVGDGVYVSLKSEGLCDF